MALLDYRKVRILTLAVTGFMPIFAMTLVMGGFRVTWFGGALAGIFSLIVTLVLSNAILTKNPWVKAVEREGILILNLTSTGIVPVGIARIKTNPLGQKLFSFMQGKEEVTRLFDREVTWTFKQPLEGHYFIDREKETGKKVIKIELEEDSFAKSVFFSDYMQFLIFNEQSGTFITKQDLSDQEREKIIAYLTLNEQREIRELKIEAHNLNRDYANRLHAVTGGFVHSTAFKFFIVVLVLVVIGALAWLYVPGLQGAILGTTQGITGPIGSGLPSTPI